MNDFIDIKYINILGSRLLKFTQSSNTTYNFRCNFCGDSKKNPNKRRGYLYEKEGRWSFKCQNCGRALPFFKFLEYVDAELYSEYQMEKYFRPKKEVVVEKAIPKPVFYETKLFEQLPSIASLGDINEYKRYVIDRMIPEEYWSRMFICEGFKKFTNKVLPGKFSDVSMDEPRLLIPFFDEKKKVFAYTGRSFKSNSQMRYINIHFREEIPSIYGLERWNKGKKTYLLEGPIDSMFLNNSIASGGGDMVATLKGVEHIKENIVCVYDNESNSHTTRNKIKKAIDHGYKVVIWPNGIKEKDINAMVLSGRKIIDIERMIHYNTYSGLKALMQLTFWK